MITKVNKVTSDTTTYQYDYENRLTKITMPDGKINTYKYDPFGRRIEKNANGVITRYVYDNEDIIIEYDGNDNIKNRYTHGPGIDEPLAMYSNNQMYYYHKDALGSVIAMTDSNGSIVQSVVYDTYGTSNPYRTPTSSSLTPTQAESTT